MELNKLGIPQSHQRDPFGLGADTVYFSEPDRHLPRWSETCFFESWSPESGAGFFTRLTRHQQDLDLWSVQLFVLLPGGRVIAHRSWGRLDAPRQAGSFNLRIKIDQPYRQWTVSFDGAGELTSTEALLMTAAGGGISVPVRFEVVATAAGPAWDLHGANVRADDVAGDGHIEQNFLTQGKMVVQGTEFSLDGVGFSDNSRGVRTLERFGGDLFLLAVMPGWSLHALNIYDMDGRETMATGTIFYPDREVPVRMIMPPLEDRRGAPADFEVELYPSGETPMTLRLITQHMFPQTITADNHSLNGIAWDVLTAGDDPLICFENIFKIEARDGSIGYGHAERGVRRSRLQHGRR